MELTHAETEATLRLRDTQLTIFEKFRCLYTSSHPLNSHYLERLITQRPPRGLYSNMSEKMNQAAPPKLFTKS